MQCLGVILARAGSKGLPGKNLLDVAGRPCIAWTIEDALSALSLSRVVVSTDGEAIARVAQGMGAPVVMRPPEMATDNAAIDDAVRHAATVAGARFDPIVILYGNVPVRPEGLIDEAVMLLIETGADSVQSYAPVGKHHPWWTARVRAGTGQVEPWEGDELNNGVYRRQDLPPAHIPDGGVIAVRRKALFHEIESVKPGPHAFLGADRRGVVTQAGDVVDIDSAIDLLVADATLRWRVSDHAADALHRRRGRASA